jgi:hypothetical protein
MSKVQKDQNADKKNAKKAEMRPFPTNKEQARDALKDQEWLIRCSVAPHGVLEALVMAEFTEEERLAWNKTSGYGDMFENSLLEIKLKNQK